MPTHTYGASGKHTVRLTVTDNDANTSYIEKDVTSSDTGTVARFRTKKDESSNLKIWFNGEYSHDAAGADVAYWLWDFGDGHTAEEGVDPGGGTIWYAASTSLADVQSAIASASPGDTVRVPAGSATWGPVAFSKGVIIKGAGIGQTNITFSSAGVGHDGSFCMMYEPSDYSLNSPFRFTGFTLDFNNNARGLALGRADGQSLGFTMQTRVRFDHNRFTNPANQWIWNACSMYACIDNNIFDGTWYGFKSDTDSLESHFWGTSPQNLFAVGSEKFTYFEDNVMNMDDQGDNVLFESQYNGRFVARYNTITGVASYSLFEFHGHQTDSYHMGSVFGGEVYGNHITVSGSASNYSISKTRGGQEMVFCNNVISGSRHYNTAYLSLTTCCDAGYSPELQRMHDIHWWNNRINTNGATVQDDISGNLSCSGLTGIPSPGRDVITQATTPGVTMGTLANRPATPALHQAYWATDQSVSTLAGMCGANPSTPIVGTLYYCKTAGVWTDTYTPYAYPHPLRSDPIVGD